MRRKVTGIGETVLDIIFKQDQPQAAVPGGSTFNSIISLGRAGVPCAIVTEAGADHVGDITCRYLKENGVSDRYVCRHDGVKSHISLAFLDANNDANYTFYKDHAGISLDDMEVDFQEGDILLFGSFFAINPVIRPQVKALLEKAKRAGATLYYDVNFRRPHLHDLPLVETNIRENMALADIVRGSAEDFGILYGETNADRLYSHHISPLCKVFICTNGGQPVALRTPAFSADYPALPVETVSTVGAGDNFNAGLLWRLRQLPTIRPEQLSSEEWGVLIQSGQRFAAEVCASLDNSISPRFAQSLQKGASLQ